MSSRLHIGIEYLAYSSDKPRDMSIEFNSLIKDIGAIVPLSFRDHVSDILDLDANIAPGSWFHGENPYYFYLSDIPSILKKYKKILAENYAVSDRELYESAVIYGTKFLNGLPLLVDFLFEQKQIYSVDSHLIRFIAWIN